MIKLRSISLSLSLSVAAGLVGCASTQTAQQPEQAPPATTQSAPEVTRPSGSMAPEPERMPMAAASSEDNYQVEPGDHLWGISGKASVYGDPYRWPLIYKANQDKIADADLIYPGQVFAIRRDATSVEISAAVQHARTRGAWTLGAVESTDRQYLSGQRYAGR